MAAHPWAIQIQLTSVEFPEWTLCLLVAFKRTNSQSSKLLRGPGPLPEQHVMLSAAPAAQVQVLVRARLPPVLYGSRTVFSRHPWEPTLQFLTYGPQRAPQRHQD